MYSLRSPNFSKSMSYVFSTKFHQKRCFYCDKTLPSIASFSYNKNARVQARAFLLTDDLKVNYLEVTSPMLVSSISILPPPIAAGS